MALTNKLAVVVIDNTRSLNSILEKHEAFLPKDICVYYYNHIKSISEYNNFLTSKVFWQNIIQENVLIIQHDSALLRNGIEEFYKWDYIGATWNFKPCVGNGGLSFRHKSAMLKVIENYYYSGTDNEDIYFSHGCTNLGLKIAPICEANKFSCETQFHLGTLGYHAIEKYLTKDQVNQIKTQYNNG